MLTGPEPMETITIKTVKNEQKTKRNDIFSKFDKFLNLVLLRLNIDNIIQHNKMPNILDFYCENPPKRFEQVF